MSTFKVVAGIAGVVVALVVVTSTRELRASRAAKTRLTERQHAYEALLTARRDLEKQAQSLEAEVANLRKQQEPRAAVGPTGVRETKPVETWDPAAGGAAFLQRHPAVRDALLTQKNAAVDSRYGPLYAALGWNEEQIEEFRRLTRQPLISLPGADPGPMIFSIEPALTSEERTRRLNALLGEDEGRKMVEIGRQESARNLVIRIATGLGFTAEPLTAQQAEALINAIPFLTSADRKTKAVDWDVLVPIARGILTPAQFPTLERIKTLETSQQDQQSARGK
jgi:hypothetical protein